MTELERLADEAEREFDARKTLPIEQLCQPTFASHDDLLLAKINQETGLFCLNCGGLITSSGVVQTQYSNGQICDSHTNTRTKVR